MNRFSNLIYNFRTKFATNHQYVEILKRGGYR